MKKITLLLLTAVCLSFSSCYNTRLLVGNVDPKEPTVEVNSIWTNHFLFGLIPGKNATMNASEYVKGQNDYVIKTNTNFLNFLVGGITLGIYTPTQTIYYTPLKSVTK